MLATTKVITDAAVFSTRGLSLAMSPSVKKSWLARTDASQIAIMAGSSAALSAMTISFYVKLSMSHFRLCQWDMQVWELTDADGA